MAYPFFSLSKSHRIAPIDFSAAASRSVSRPCPITAWHHLGRRHPDLGRQPDRRGPRRGLRTSRLMATPYEILTLSAAAHRATISA
jgi:plasmid replication initiation protein